MVTKKKSVTKSVTKVVVSKKEKVMRPVEKAKRSLEGLSRTLTAEGWKRSLAKKGKKKVK